MLLIKQAGHKSLEQFGVGLRLLSNCVVTLVMKVLLWAVDVKMLVVLFQIFGKLKKGNPAK
jgi:hypothetical protein